MCAKVPEVAELMALSMISQAQRRFAQMRRVACRVQATWRMTKARLSYLRLRRVALLCQSQRRGVLAARRAQVLRRHRSAAKIQAMLRRRLAMRMLQGHRSAAMRIQARARAWSCRRHYLVSLAESKEQAKLENQVKALKAKLEAQERASSNEEAPAEILEALQALGAENAKLHLELDKLRDENEKLRKENQKLRAMDTARGAKLAAGSRAKKYDDHKHEEEAQEERTFSLTSEMSTVASTAPVRSLQLYPPLNEFWEDVPCIGIPYLQSGSVVHLKLGANILFVDLHGKSLMWQPWMGNHDGYRNAMSFVVERCADEAKHKGKRSSLWGSSPKDTPRPTEGSIGENFVLRSSWTTKYVKMGGLLDWYCLQVSAKSPEDAQAFTCRAVYSSSESYSFALKLTGKDKYLSLQSDGSVGVEKVPDIEAAPNKANFIAGFECLLPATSYDIVIYDHHIGLTVSKDLPLRVVGFKHVSHLGRPSEAGPAEASGRVRVGDVITNVNGQDIARLQREEVLNLINAERPVTLRFLSVEPF